jgi:hypothetical protein
MGGRETLFFYLGGKSRLMLDYLCLLYMIDNGSLSLKANERVRERTLS